MHKDRSTHSLNPVKSKGIDNLLLELSNEKANTAKVKGITAKIRKSFDTVKDQLLMTDTYEEYYQILDRPSTANYTFRSTSDWNPSTKVSKGKGAYYTFSAFEDNDPTATKDNVPTKRNILRDPTEKVAGKVPELIVERQDSCDDEVAATFINKEMKRSSLLSPSRALGHSISSSYLSPPRPRKKGFSSDGSVTISEVDMLEPKKRDKYFGIEAKLNFNNTYIELHKKRQILDGDAQLLDVVKGVKNVRPSTAPNESVFVKNLKRSFKLVNKYCLSEKDMNLEDYLLAQTATDIRTVTDSPHISEESVASEAFELHLPSKNAQNNSSVRHFPTVAASVVPFATGEAPVLLESKNGVNVINLVKTPGPVKSQMSAATRDGRRMSSPRVSVPGERESSVKGKDAKDNLPAKRGAIPMISPRPFRKNRPSFKLESPPASKKESFHSRPHLQIPRIRPLSSSVSELTKYKEETGIADTVDGILTTTFEPNSPRAMYITGCLQYSLPPRNILLRPFSAPANRRKKSNADSIESPEKPPSTTVSSHIPGMEQEKIDALFEEYINSKPTVIDLRNRGLDDRVGLLLADSLRCRNDEALYLDYSRARVKSEAHESVSSGVPCVDTVLLGGNNFTRVSIPSIIDSILFNSFSVEKNKAISTIVELDLSGIASAVIADRKQKASYRNANDRPATATMKQVKQNADEEDSLLAPLYLYLSRSTCVLRKLKLSGCDLDDKDLFDLSNALLRNNGVFNELDISSNRIGERDKMDQLDGKDGKSADGGEILGSVLRNRSFSRNGALITHLNVQDNRLNSIGALDLCNSVQYCQNLIHLDISSNNIGNEGAIALGSALIGHQSMSSLIVANNNIGPEGSFVIAVGVRESHNIHYLDISGNSIGELGGRALMTTSLTKGSNKKMSMNFRFCDVRECSAGMNLREVLNEGVAKTISRTKSAGPIRPQSKNNTSMVEPANFTDVAGNYTLNMASNFGRALMLDVLHKVSLNPDLEIVEYELNSNVNVKESKNASLKMNPICSLMRVISSDFESVDLELAEKLLLRKYQLHAEFSKWCCAPPRKKEPIVVLSPVISAVAKVKEESSRQQRSHSPLSEKFSELPISRSASPRPIEELGNAAPPTVKIFPGINDLTSSQLKSNSLIGGALDHRCILREMFDELDTEREGCLKVESAKKLLYRLEERANAELKFAVGNDLEIDFHSVFSMDGSKYVESLLRSVDGSNSGMVEYADLRYLIQLIGMEANAKIRDILHEVYVAQSNSPMTKFNPPTSGIVTMKVVNTHNFFNSECLCVTESQVARALEVVRSANDPERMLSYLLTLTPVRFREAVLLIDSIAQQSGDYITPLALILPYVISPRDAVMLVNNYLENSAVRLNKLITEVGGVQLLNLYCGQFNGFYSLNLEKLCDRKILSRLLSISSCQETILLNSTDSERRKSRFSVIGESSVLYVFDSNPTLFSNYVMKQKDTSQYGNGSCFRNEFMINVPLNSNGNSSSINTNSAPLTKLSSVTGNTSPKRLNNSVNPSTLASLMQSRRLSKETFLTIPTSGLVQFDFCTRASRPICSLDFVCSDDQVLHLFWNLGLMKSHSSFNAARQTMLMNDNSNPKANGEILHGNPKKFQWSKEFLKRLVHSSMRMWSPGNHFPWDDDFEGRVACQCALPIDNNDTLNDGRTENVFAYLNNFYSLLKIRESEFRAIKTDYCAVLGFNVVVKKDVVQSKSTIKSCKIRPYDIPRGRSNGVHLEKKPADISVNDSSSAGNVRLRFDSGEVGSGREDSPRVAQYRRPSIADTIASPRARSGSDAGSKLKKEVEASATQSRRRFESVDSAAVKKYGEKEELASSAVKSALLKSGDNDDYENEDMLSLEELNDVKDSDVRFGSIIRFEKLELTYPMVREKIRNRLLQLEANKEIRLKAAELAKKQKVAASKRFTTGAIRKDADAIVNDTVTINVEIPIITILTQFFSGHRCLCCRHIVLLFELFDSARADCTVNFGSYRVEILVSLYSRIIDISQNICSILSILSTKELACFIARIGYLNGVVSVWKLDQTWKLDLTRREERMIIFMLAKLAEVEPLSWKRVKYWSTKGLKPSFECEGERTPDISKELNGYIKKWSNFEYIPCEGQLLIQVSSSSNINALLKANIIEKKEHIDKFAIQMEQFNERQKYAKKKAGKSGVLGKEFTEAPVLELRFRNHGNALTSSKARDSLSFYY